MGRVEEPQTPEALAGLLAAASRERHSTVLRGGGTKSGWGRPAPEAALTVSTNRLTRLVAHRYGDLTATVQAGMRLADLNRELSAHRQWLPIESAFDAATIGGVVATNDCGPMRHRSGTPRDLLIGITLALTDGRIVKAGGHVVKNVAGYDLGRLVSGSFGTFAAIVDATFKLMPVPQTTATLVADYADAASMARDVAALLASQLEPAAVDLRQPMSSNPHPSLLIKFASSPASTTEQVNHASALLTGTVSLVTGEAETQMWHEQIRTPWVTPGPKGPADVGRVLSGPPTVVRMSWLPSRLADVLALVRGHAFTGRAIGTGMVRIEADAAAAAALVERLRASDALRHVVVLQAPAALTQQLDAWGPPLSSAPAALALKKMFDPAGILNAGRGPI